MPLTLLRRNRRERSARHAIGAKPIAVAAIARPIAVAAGAMLVAVALCPLTAAAQSGTAAARAEPIARPAAQAPTSDYWVYVGAESADELYRVRFGPAGAAIEKTIVAGELAAEMEGPHGLAITPDGRFMHLTTGHGFPDGKYWVYLLGPDTLIAPGVLTGNFPATVDVTPDGRYGFSANFNYHGDMVPSSVSAVYIPTMTEVAQIVTCTMPHGSRVSPDGQRHYSACMMDDQLVEIDVEGLKVSRRFSVAQGKEGPLDPSGGDMLAMWIDGSLRVSGGRTADPAEVGYAAMEHEHEMAPNSCSPTWAQPSTTGAKIYVACNKSDEILEIDRDAWKVTRRIATGRGPYNMAVTPDGNLLVATLKQGAQFEIYDLATGRSLARIPTSNTVAHGVTVSSDSRYAFVTSEGVGAAPGKVDIYDLRARMKVATVDVGQQASGIAFWKTEPVGK